MAQTANTTRRKEGVDGPEQEGLGEAIESAHRLERKREPGAQARPDEREEDEGRRSRDL